MSYGAVMTTKKKSTKKQLRAPIAPEMGRFMLAVRESRGMSQRQFAEAVDKNFAYIHHLEHGSARYPTETIKMLTKEQKEAALKIMINYLKQEIEL